MSPELEPVRYFSHAPGCFPRWQVGLNHTPKSLVPLLRETHISSPGARHHHLPYLPNFSAAEIVLRRCESAPLRRVGRDFDVTSFPAPHTQKWSRRARERPSQPAHAALACGFPGANHQLSLRKRLSDFPPNLGAERVQSVTGEVAAGLKSWREGTLYISLPNEAEV